MNYCKWISVVACSCLVASAQSPDAGKVTTVVKRAITYAQQNGMDKLIAQTNQAHGLFHVGTGSELYLFIYDQTGTVKAIGFNTEALVGTNRITLKDPDGVMIIKAFINTAKTSGKGWVDYKYPNPITNKLDQKSSYVELYEGLILGCGMYKK